MMDRWLITTAARKERWINHSKAIWRRFPVQPITTRPREPLDGPNRIIG
jgi:hypothetical protein